MLDVRPTSYLVPLDEQTIGPITPLIHVENLADEDATVTGLVRIYRESLGTLIYSSVLHPTAIAHGASADIAVETEFDPGAPADDDYFCLAEITARSVLTGNSETAQLGQFFFDVKPAPMGPVPATHATTHEDGGMDEVSIAGLSGLAADPQTPANHAPSHEDGGADPLNVGGLHGELADDQPALAHDIAGPKHTSGATPGQILQADANGLPVDATNTDAEVDAAVGTSHARQHSIIDTSDHTSAATPGQILQADANGLPVDATNTNAAVTAAVAASHADEICDLPQTLTDQANIDWDLSLGGAAQVTLGGNRTLNAPTNMVDGARYRLKVIQDGTGTRLITWNAAYRFPGGVDPCLTAAINCIDIITFDCDGSHMDCVGMVNALA
jgi:hypothetical protein